MKVKIVPTRFNVSKDAVSTSTIVDLQFLLNNPRYDRNFEENYHILELLKSGRPLFITDEEPVLSEKGRAVKIETNERIDLTSDTKMLGLKGFLDSLPEERSEAEIWVDELRDSVKRFKLR